MPENKLKLLWLAGKRKIKLIILILVFLSLGAAFFIYQNLGQVRDNAKAAELGVWTGWGGNSFGNLARGDTSSLNGLVQMSNLENVVRTSNSGTHILVLRTDGTVWAAGSNSYGQLGYGGTANRSTLVQVLNLDNVTRISAGVNYSMAIKSDGTVWAWGRNHFGQFGNSTTSSSAQTFPIQVLTGYKEISTSEHHTIGIKTDNTVWTWGRNHKGQLGDGTTTNRNFPTQISTLGNTATQVLAQGNTEQTAKSMALLSNGALYVWGSNSFGEIGNGTAGATNQTTPFNTLNSVAGIPQVSGYNSSEQSSAVRTDGTVWGWGIRGNFANASSSNSSPLQVTGFSSITMITQSGQNILGLRSTDSKVYGAGFSLPNNTLPIYGSVYEILLSGAAFNNVLRINSTNFVRNNGRAYSYGNNENYQQAFNNTQIMSDFPTKINLTNISKVESMARHALALRSDGTVWAWGNNAYGQLGNNTTTDAYSPVQVLQTGGTALTNVRDIAVTREASFAVKNDNTVWSWGINTVGQLGLGDNTQRNVATQIPSFTNIKRVSGTGDGAVAVKFDGTVWGWGSNNSNMLATTGTNYNSPLRVDDGTTTNSDAQGMVTSIFLIKNNGTVLARGQNSFGQLGNNSTTNSSTYVTVGITNVSKLATVTTNNQSVMALKTDGTVWTWGEGIGTTPTQKTGLTTVSQIAHGGTRFAALQSGDSKVYTWGSGIHSGNGNLDDNTTPIVVSNLTNVSNLAGGSFSNFYAQGDIPTYITTADLANLTPTCTNYYTFSTTACSFNLPANKDLPPDFKLGVGDAAPGGICTQTVFGQPAVTCINVPTGSNSDLTIPIRANIAIEPIQITQGNSTLWLSVDNVTPCTPVPSAVEIGNTYNCDFPLINATNNQYYINTTETRVQTDTSLLSMNTCSVINNLTTSAILRCQNIPTANAQLGIRNIILTARNGADMGDVEIIAINNGVVTSGLGLYYDAGLTGSYDPTNVAASQYVFDLSGNSKFGWLGSSLIDLNFDPSFISTGPKSFSLNDTLITSSLASNFSNVVTAEFWMKRANNNNLAAADLPQRLYAQPSSTVTDSNLGLGIQGTTIRATTNNGTLATHGSPFIPNTEWQYVSFTYDSATGNGQIYVNGALQHTFTRTTNAFSGNNILFGMLNSTLSTATDRKGFVGEMAVIRMYNRVLSSTEINQNLNVDRTRFGMNQANIQVTAPSSFAFGSAGFSFNSQTRTASGNITLTDRRSSFNPWSATISMTNLTAAGVGGFLIPARATTVTNGTQIVTTGSGLNNTVATSSTMTTAGDARGILSNSANNGGGVFSLSTQLEITIPPAARAANFTGTVTISVS